MPRAKAILVFTGLQKADLGIDFHFYLEVY